MNHIAKRPVILCFADYYLPGYRAGGPVRSISNFVDCFGDEYDIRIVTRDRDFLNPDSYPDIRIDNWNWIGKASVFYASRRFLSFFGVLKLLRGTTHDVLYLNSFCHRENAAKEMPLACEVSFFLTCHHPKPRKIAG